MDFESNLCLKAVSGIEKNTEAVINMEAQNLILSNFTEPQLVQTNQQARKQTNPLPNQKTDKGQANGVAPTKAALPVLFF